MSFVSKIDHRSAESLAFIFQGTKLLVKNGDQSVRVLSGEEVARSKIPFERPMYIGETGGRPCFCARADRSAEPEGDAVFHGLRDLFGNLDDSIFRAAGLGLQVNNWDLDSRYCGHCGNPMELNLTERAKQCVACGRVEYPRISPAVIMSVTRGDEILLARSTRIKYSFHSVLAGYVEVGENLEDCVRREICEEVGLRVGNIEYFGSQSWPFTGSLMIAFTTEYDSGKIRVDNTEIREAGWFKPDNLPSLPGWGSISRRLVEAFVERAKEK